MYAYYTEVTTLPYGVSGVLKKGLTLNFESISSRKLRDVDSDGN